MFVAGNKTVINRFLQLTPLTVLLCTDTVTAAILAGLYCLCCEEKFKLKHKNITLDFPQRILQFSSHILE